jgi:hypothetical protein
VNSLQFLNFQIVVGFQAVGYPSRKIKNEQGPSFMKGFDKTEGFATQTINKFYHCYDTRPISAIIFISGNSNN